MTKRLELSPLTAFGMLRRITADLHPGRSEEALCVAVTALHAAAVRQLDPAEALLCLRGLALKAKPDEYAEAVRQQLAAVEEPCAHCERVAHCEDCGGCLMPCCSDEDCPPRCSCGQDRM